LGRRNLSSLVIPAQAGIQFLAFDLHALECQSFHSPAASESLSLPVQRK
jgi:hypothetical protein